MDSQRLSPSRGTRNTTRLPFTLAVFERKLRAALDIEDGRECGEPGSTPPDFTGGPRRALTSWLSSSMLSKYDPGTGGEQRVKAAMDKFWQAEEKCFWANLKFSQPHTVIDKDHPLLNRARELILKLLGPEVPLSEVARGFGFGPGSSTRVPKAYGDALYKYSADAEITPNALSLGNAAILANPIWKQMYPISDGLLPLVTVWGNKVTTVPKNYKIDRVIAVEPCLNMYVQKGLGDYLRRRLKKVGVDLDDQTLNQKAARDLSLATIDFSMASDLISQGICSYLLPPQLVDIIGYMRCEFGVVDDHVLHRWSKVSSMGNGFTFELESLIFWALAAAVVPVDQHNRIRVYGDDVILPSEYAVQFMELSRAAGFIPNSDKSFWSGPFRESCGKHYYEGYDISPFYIKRPVNTLTELFLLHNNLWRWLQRADCLLTSEQYTGVKAILTELRRLAPAKWRKPALPDGYGDDAFIGSFAECEPQVCSRGHEHFTVPVFMDTPIERKMFSVPDGSAWIKADKILRNKRWILPRVYTVELTVEPARKARKRRRLLSVPWWAWG